MSVSKLARRLLVPRFVTALYYYFRFGAKVSPRAEVELSPLLTFGRDCVVGSFTKIKAADGPVRFGNRCGIANSCFIDGGTGGLVVGHHFGCGPNVAIIASEFPWNQIDLAPSDQRHPSLGIRIGDNVDRKSV